ncbi:MAG: PAS domain-containing protein [candidate division WOR-3 bacterium]
MRERRPSKGTLPFHCPPVYRCINVSTYCIGDAVGCRCFGSSRDNLHTLISTDIYVRFCYNPTTMEHADSTKSLLIKTLGEVCKASVQLEKLDRERESAKHLLSSVRESYRQLMEDTPSALLLVDSQGNIVASNRPSQDLLGYAEEELVAMNLQQLYVENGSAEFNRSLRQVLDDGAGTIRGLSAFRKDGQGILLDTLFIVVTHEDRSMVQVTLNQATERLKAHADEQRYVERLESLSRGTLALLNLPITENLYKTIGEQVKVLVGDAYVVVSSFLEPSNTFSVQAVSGPEKQDGMVLGLLLRHLVGVTFRMSQGEFRQYVATCTPTPVSGGLSSLFLNKLSRDVYNAVQDFSLVGCTYAAGLVSAGQVLGMVTILMPKGARLDHAELVTTFIEQSSHILKLRNREYGEPSTTRPETLVEDFQSVLLGELPLSLEPEEPLLGGESEQSTEEGTRKISLEEQVTHPIKGPEEQPPGKHERESPEREPQPEPDYRRLRHLFGYRKILVIDDE